MKIELLAFVLVPFEWDGKTWTKRDDLPRFILTKDVIDYLTSHPDASFRRRPGMVAPEHIRLEWREHSEPDLIKEYTDGVGTPAFLRRSQRRK